MSDFIIPSNLITAAQAYAATVTAVVLIAPIVLAVLSFCMTAVFEIFRNAPEYRRDFRR